MDETKLGFGFIGFCLISGLLFATYFGTKQALEDLRQETKNLKAKVSATEKEIEKLKNRNSKVVISVNEKERQEQEHSANPLLQYFPENELKIIRKEAVENHCTGELFYVLLAIRKAEGGRKGLEFGVLHPKARNTNLEIQAGWAAATVAKNYQRWKNAGRPDDFIIFLGNRYCPVGSANDPDGLNKNWIGNVKHWYSKLRSL